MDRFWWDVLAALLGSAFGVGLALLVDRLTAAHRRRAEKRVASEKRDESEASQLRIAQWLIEENMELANQAIAAIDGGHAFFFKMNTHLLDLATTQLATLSQDQELLWKLEHFRYQLHHVNEKIDAHSEAVMFQGIPTAEARRIHEKSLVPSLRKHLAEIIVLSGSELVRPLTTRIQRLSRIQRPPIRPPLQLPEPVRNITDGDA